ncbi:MAG: hypothetical protein LDL33_02115 [Desulfomonile sp.]|nr:hypothetical protein [Desulfomonile sp.]
MAEEQSETRHAIVITGFADDSCKPGAAQIIARISRGAPVEKIIKRLDSLPWTLTRSASPSAAARLSKLLERSGARVEVAPPLPEIAAEAPPPKIPESKGPGTLEERQPVPEVVEIAPTTPEAPPSPPREPEPDFRPIPSREEQPLEPLTTPTRRYEGVAELSFPDQSALSIEPLTLGGILDRTFHLCRRHFWPLLGIVAIPWLAVIAIVVVVVAVVGIYGVTHESLGETATWTAIIVAALAIPSALVAIIGLFFISTGAVIHAVSLAHLGRTVRIRAAYNFVFQRLGRYFLTSMLFSATVFLMAAAALVLGVGFYMLSNLLTSSGWWSAVTWPFLLFVPLYGFTKLVLFDKVVIIEDVAYGQALRRSWRLLSGKAESSWPRNYFVRLVILLNLFFFINIAISLLFSTPAALLAALFPESPAMVGKVISQILEQAGSVVAGLFGSVCLVVFYYDIRNRKEGFDLKMLAGIEKSATLGDREADQSG